METSLKKESFSNQSERTKHRKTPLRALKQSISLHKTSAGLKSREELPIISDFYLSDMSLSTKRNFFVKKNAFLSENEDVPLSRNAKFFEQLPASLRQFFQKKREFVDLLENFDKIAGCVENIVDTIKCYRGELGNLLEKTQKGYTILFEKLLKATMNYSHESEERYKTQLQSLLEKISDLEQEKKDLHLKNMNLRSLNNFQESEYKICKMNNDSLQTELILLHELLKKDIFSLINHVAVIENANQKTSSDNDLADKLSDLNDLFVNLETEQANKKEVINSMNNLLKAMLKGGKQDMAIQVNEAELIWTANMIIETDTKLIKLPTFVEIENSCVNFDKIMTNSVNLTKNNVDLVRLKEKELTEFDEKDKNNWNLPASLIVFLENTLTNNEGGRVMPWLHFKKNIFAIYNERIHFQNEMKACLGSNFIALDEFLCLYYIKVHKVRRIAEIKLFEFLISLKYYSKIWPRAILFANICNIIPYSKGTQENFPYNFDCFAQEYFFYCYLQLLKDNSAIVEHNDGQTYIKKEKSEDLLKNLVFFAGEPEKKRFSSKITKITKKIENESSESLEVIDVDKILEFSIEEFFEAKKRNFKNLSKKFQKICETNNGLLSYEDYKLLLSEFIEQQSPIEKYCYCNDIIKLKSFLFTITAGKNGNDIAQKDFNETILKFGIDCPFPVVSTQKRSYKLLELSKNIGKNEEENNKDGDIISRGLTKEDIVDKSVEGKSANSSFVQEKKNKNFSIIEHSAYFGQHFTILRELKIYTNQFKEAIAVETNQEILMRHFNNICNILDAACQFFKFPIKY